MYKYVIYNSYLEKYFALKLDEDGKKKIFYKDELTLDNTVFTMDEGQANAKPCIKAVESKDTDGLKKMYNKTNVNLAAKSFFLLEVRVGEKNKLSLNCVYNIE